MLINWAGGELVLIIFYVGLLINAGHRVLKYSDCTWLGL